MRTFLQVLMSALVLVLGAAMLPATAASSDGFQAAVMSNATSASTVHVASLGNLSSHDIKHMTLGQAASIIGGAIVGGSLVDMVLDGTVFTILGVVGGAVLGNEWYDRGMWPFSSSH
jgi:outer membrane lipoprotein SlyB